MKSLSPLNLGFTPSQVSAAVSLNASSSRAPRIVRNNVVLSDRIPDAGTILGTGAKVQSIETNAAGVQNGLLRMESGSAGRAMRGQTLTLTAGQWYALSCEVVEATINSPATMGMQVTAGTAAIDRTTGNVLGTQIAAGGLGRYSMAIMSRAGGTITWQLGVGLNTNQANQVLTVKNLMIETIDSTAGLCCSEYVMPGRVACFDYEKHITVDANGKVTQPEPPALRFNVKPFSNILCVGDSRMDESYNIGGMLDAALAATGAAHIYAEAGWTTTNVINGITEYGVTATLDTALAGTLLRSTWSVAGAYEVYDYTYPGAYPFDTLLIGTLGFNNINDTTGLGADQVMSDIEVICEKALSAGIKNIVITDNNPCKNATNVSATRVAALKVLNQRLKDYANIKGYVFVSIYEALADATDIDLLSNGAGATPDYRQTTVDLLHPNQAGSTVIAALVKNRIDVYK